MNELRRRADTGPARRLLLSPKVRYLGSRALMLRYLPAAWAVETPLSLLARCVTRRGRGCYPLRDGKIDMLVRHDTGALELLDEIFRRGCYDPPPELAERLPTTPQILDLGGNVGAFSAFALRRWPTGKVTSVEADAENVAVLKAFRELNAPDRLAVIPAFAGTTATPVRFLGGLGAGSHRGESGSPVPGIDALPLIAEADFVKMDIEGGEWEILADPRLADVGSTVLVLEYHRFGAPSLPALGAACRLLANAGFQTGFAEPNYWGHGELWAWK